MQGPLFTSLTVSLGCKLPEGREPTPVLSSSDKAFVHGGPASKTAKGRCWLPSTHPCVCACVMWAEMCGPRSATFKEEAKTRCGTWWAAEKGFKDRADFRSYLKGILHMNLCGGFQPSKRHSFPLPLSTMRKAHAVKSHCR